jgi:thiol:disulfide interchange protein
MKPIRNLVLIVCLMAGFVTEKSAQSQSAPGTIEKAEVYKASSEGWLVNIDEAYAISKKTGKPIMANFTGSDWCGWCKRLKANVFVHDEFKQWAEKNVVLLELDFPRSFKIPAEIQQQNASLQSAFQVQGFPTVWVFDLEKDNASNQYSISALGKTGYTATAKEFIDGVNQMLGKN